MIQKLYVCYFEYAKVGQMYSGLMLVLIDLFWAVEEVAGANLGCCKRVWWSVDRMNGMSECSVNERLGGQVGNSATTGRWRRKEERREGKGEELRLSVYECCIGRLGADWLGILLPFSFSTFSFPFDGRGWSHHLYLSPDGAILFGQWQ